MGGRDRPRPRGRRGVSSTEEALEFRLVGRSTTAPLGATRKTGTHSTRISGVPPPGDSARGTRRAVVERLVPCAVVGAPPSACGLAGRLIRCAAATTPHSARASCDNVRDGGDRERERRAPFGRGPRRSARTRLALHYATFIVQCADLGEGLERDRRARAAGERGERLREPLHAREVARVRALA